MKYDYTTVLRHWVYFFITVEIDGSQDTSDTYQWSLAQSQIKDFHNEEEIAELKEEYKHHRLPKTGR